MWHKQRQQDSFFEHILSLFKLSNIIKSDIGIKHHNLFFEHFDQVAIRTVTVRIDMFEKRFVLLWLFRIFWVFGVGQPWFSVISAFVYAAVICTYWVLVEIIVSRRFGIVICVSDSPWGSWLFLRPYLRISLFELPLSLLVLPLFFSFSFYLIPLFHFFLFSIVNLIIFMHHRFHFALLKPISITLTYFIFSYFKIFKIFLRMLFFIWFSSINNIFFFLQVTL